MRVLVTGGTGFIGSVAVEMLQRSGHELTVLDDSSSGHSDTLPKNVTFIEGSICDRGVIHEALVGCEAVLHFAGLASVAESVKYPERYWEVNVEGSRNLLEEMQSSGVKRIVFSSSASVYGEPIKSPTPESAPLNPSSPYGSSKKEVEELINSHCMTSGLAAYSLRYFNVAGAVKTQRGWLSERHEPETHLIPNILRSRAEAPVEIYGDDWNTPDGTCIRDYVHVIDVVAAHLTALTKLVPKSHEIINLGSGAGYSVRAILEEASKVLKRELPFAIKPRRLGDPAVLVADISNARRKLHWSPKLNLQKMLEDAEEAIRPE